ncbi:MAG: PfkB family carbohydrate kinase, partial [Pseudomonadota bacterium]|nr:PfkB family carbohydrate kinase [Pseudomonadota bacterium]
LDRFVEGSVERISPEAPIPVITVRSEESMLGAAGNVLRNLSALGASGTLWAAIGDDAPGAEVAGMLATVANCDASLQTINGRQTAIKTRYIASGQQMMRADRETIEDIPQECQDAIFAAVEAQLSTARALLLSDYGKGVLVEGLVSRLIRVAREKACPVVVDPKGTEYGRYRGADVVTPNRQELVMATNMPVGDDDETVAAC